MRDQKLYDDIERLAKLATDLGVDAQYFDDMVYNMSLKLNLDNINSHIKNDLQLIEIGNAEDVASTINNSGIEAQIDFLISNNSFGTIQAEIDYIESYIRDVAS